MILISTILWLSWRNGILIHGSQCSKHSTFLVTFVSHPWSAFSWSFYRFMYHKLCIDFRDVQMIVYFTCNVKCDTHNNTFTLQLSLWKKKIQINTTVPFSHDVFVVSYIQLTYFFRTLVWSFVLWILKAKGYNTDGSLLLSGERPSFRLRTFMSRISTRICSTYFYIESYSRETYNIYIYIVYLYLSDLQPEAGSPLSFYVSKTLPQTFADISMDFLRKI